MPACGQVFHNSAVADGLKSIQATAEVLKQLLKMCCIFLEVYKPEKCSKPGGSIVKNLFKI